MSRGTMMTIKGGVVTRITISVAMTLRNVKMKERSERGIISSMMYVSFENLFRTRPSGVVSKKHMGDLIMFCSMELWREREA